MASRFRRLDAEKLAAAKAEFASLEKAGILRRSNSPWASPLHMVRKADGSWRPCSDYRRLNAATVPDTYPLPKMMDFTSRIAGCTIFSKVDLKKGYHQIPMNVEDIPKTAITTPFGLFEFTRMTFGMRNAGSTFQHLMDRVLEGEDSAFAYLNDILISSKTQEDHRRHLQQVFSRLQATGLAANGDKCLFNATELEFLGHHVSASGIRPLPAKVAAILAHPQPATANQLQQFLRVYNFYRRFIPAAAKTLRPLRDALKGVTRKKEPIQSSAFKAAKASLAAAVELAHPRQGAELALLVDASDNHVGAVLQQRPSAAAAAWQPLGFYSKKLDPAQTRYSAFDRELLACVMGIRHFRFMVEGRSFTLYTDHKPLTFALPKAAKPWSARQCHHLSYIAEFTSDIRHISGVSNVVADTLSRPPQEVPLAAAVCVAPTALDYTAIAAAQRTCPSMQEAKDSILQLQLVPFGTIRVICDVSRQHPQPVIPSDHRRRVFDAFHSLARNGTRVTKRLMKERVIWPSMAKDITAGARDCQACSRAKVTKQPAAAVQPIPVQCQRFSHIHVDLVGPLPTSKEGYRYLFTIIDRTSRWLEAVPLAAMDAEACAGALISNWVAGFGVPAAVTSDQGRQFTSALWGHACRALGIQHNTTTAYHPQSNGMVERVHRQLKEALKARLATADWPQHLPWVLLGIRNAPKEDSGCSAAELVFGTTLALPGQLTAEEELPIAKLLESIRTAAPIPTRHGTWAPPTEPPQHLRQSNMVYIRRGGQLPPLTPPYDGPYLVLEKGPKYFKLQMGDREVNITVDRLKPHQGDGPATPAAPASRGHPPAALAAQSPTAMTPQLPTSPVRSRSPSLDLPALTLARPARVRRLPSKLDL
ncbi:MAG: DDE-type integrase/transposase/recombinase [Nitrospiraceae bacterium]|nr:DDE-type integrase/transposase/recombinase [Nitrospiraceae bacterium]